MKKHIVIVVTFFTLLGFALSAQGAETYFKFKFESKAEINKLTKMISIDNVDGDIVYAYANDKQLENFRRLGIEFTELPHPGTLIQPRMSSDKAEIKNWDVYPTYDAYVSMMNQFAVDYPGLCRIVNAGSSVEGRSILFAVISDNVDTEEDEPEVMFTATMHGDETFGYIGMLRLIDTLLSSYGTDSLINRLVDSCEVWINPLANPDGTYNGGNNTVFSATRYNANSVDLNRNFPDFLQGDHPDGNSWQPETIAMMNIAEAQSFVISANFHSGAEVVNYPWDSWSTLHTDDAWFIYISHLYADSAQYYSPSGYMDGFNDGITNGYQWYMTHGSRQDYMNWWHGCRESTIEHDNTKLTPESELNALWIYNRVSFLNWLEEGLHGIRGIVTDSATGLPIAATVTVVGHDIDNSQVYTDPDVGNYHRMIEPGTYDLEFTAPGFVAKTVSNISTTYTSAVRIDVALAPLTSDPIVAYDEDTAPDANPGDTVTFTISIKNLGGGNAYNVDGTLGTDDSYITVSQSYSQFPLLTAEGGTASSNDDYQFIISEDSPNYRYVQFYLDVTADGGYSERIYFDYYIGARSIAYYDNFSFDLGWSGLGGSGDWEIGPAGGGSGGSGAGDPSQDHSPTTDNYLLGNNLSPSDGTYGSSLGTTYWVTSPYIDCSNMTGVQMSLYRWLGIESSTYDNAYLDVYNGSSWVTVYHNSGSVDESSWSEQLYDVSAQADGNPDFRVRFGIGPTDGSVQYCGWNIDDLKIEGYGEVSSGTPQFAYQPDEISDSLFLDGSTVDTLVFYNNGDGLLRMRCISTDTWLTFNQDQQNVAAGDSLILPVTITTSGLAAGDNLGTIEYTSNDPDSTSGTIPIYLHIFAPDIQLPQTSIDESLAAEEQSSQTFIINNAGPGQLDYNISRLMFSGKSETKTKASTPVSPIGYYPSDPDKPGDAEPFFAPVTKNSGGPDNWGYIWVDSDDPSGPAYDWIDISAVGTEITGFSDDDSSTALPIGFDFPFYENSYSTIHIGSNGILTFGSGSTARTNTNLPNNGAPNNLIAMWWDDLDPRRGGNIFYYHDAANERFIVSFDQIKNYYSSTGTGSLSFQAVLYAAGEIILQYAVMDPGSDAAGLAGATIGIENSTGSDGLAVVYDAAYMHDYLAIRLMAANWLSVSPASGTIAPFASDTIQVGFDAAGLTQDIYSGQLTISSNDPDSPVIDIPVTMTVSGQSMPPEAPELLSPDNGAVSVTIPATLDWDDVSSIDLYNMQIDTTVSFTSPLLDSNLAASGCALAELNEGATYYWRARAHNDVGWGDWSEVRNFTTAVSWLCGDPNSDGSVNIIDVTFIISYLYKDGPAPIEPKAGDVDNSGTINILDVTNIINYLYKDGPPLDCPS